MRNVSSLEGLTSLAAAVSRTSIIMLSEVASYLLLPAYNMSSLFDSALPAANAFSSCATLLSHVCILAEGP